MNHIMENLKYHTDCMHTWEKYLQEGNPITDDILANLNEHKRLYRQLKDQLIAESEPRMYRVQMTNTLTGAIRYSQLFSSTFEANRFKDDTEDIYPFMLCTVEVA